MKFSLSPMLSNLSTNKVDVFSSEGRPKRPRGFPERETSSTGSYSRSHFSVGGTSTFEVAQFNFSGKLRGRKEMKSLYSFPCFLIHWMAKSDHCLFSFHCSSFRRMKMFERDHHHLFKIFLYIVKRWKRNLNDFNWIIDDWKREMKNLMKNWWVWRFVQS